VSNTKASDKGTGW